jgi:Lipocalin-like domain
MYSADGQMCGVEMNPDRPKWRNSEEPTQEEKASAFDGSYGYCGPYEIDTKRSQLIHLPEVSTGPGYLGTRQIRPHRFEGNRLILSGGIVEDQPEVVSWTVVWEKVR